MLPEQCRGANRKKAIAVGILAVLAMGVVFFAVVAVLSWMISSGELTSFSVWVEKLGVWGNVIIGLVLAILNIPPLVGYILVIMLCGYLYGFWWGLLTVILGSAVGWFLTFLAIRKLFYARAEKYLEEKGGFVARAMMQELGVHQKTVALLVRIGPIPPGVQNAVLAVSPVHTIHFVWSSFLGLLVKQIPLTFIGSGVADIMEITSGEGEGNNKKDITLLVLGGLGALFLFIFGCFISKKAVDTAKRIQEEEEGLVEHEQGREEELDEFSNDNWTIQDDDGMTIDLSPLPDIALSEESYSPTTTKQLNESGSDMIV